MLQSQFGLMFPEAGADEAGRGCLAGPVVAAAVIFPTDYKNEHLNDSKKLSAAKREELRSCIMRDALAWAVAEVPHNIIDEINILNASFMAMHQALDQLNLRPEHILIDGNRFKSYGKVPHQCIIQGDGKYLSIAAASILAKTHRDELMVKLSKDFPEYGWERNKGYGTEEHRNAIIKLGYTEYHRRSFVINGQLGLF